MDWRDQNSCMHCAGSKYHQSYEGLSPALCQVASEPVAGIVSLISERSKVTRNFNNELELYSCMTYSLFLHLVFC